MRKLTFRALAASAVATTGVAAAGSLTSMAGASVPSSAWAALRQCESTNNYHADTGNGFYGAYQFTLSSWHAVGMSGNPANASPAEQLTAAKRLLAMQGWQAWPSCSAQLGLARYGTNPGSTAAPTAIATSAPAPAPAPAPSSGNYTVKPGDTLSGIAAQHQESWQALYQKNQQNIANPNLIFPGETLSV